MISEFDSLVLYVITFAAILGIFYYALRILNSMRYGNLEKSWRYLSVGAVFAIGAMIAVVLVNTPVVAWFSPAVIRLLSSDISPGLSALATIFFLVGFRAHFKVWNPKGLSKSDQVESERITIKRQRRGRRATNGEESDSP